MSPLSKKNPIWHYNMGCLVTVELNLVTPDYKGLQLELETTETCYTSFLSLKHPDFKNVIFKILEISLCDSPARQHSRFGLIHPDLGRMGCAA